MPKVTYPRPCPSCGKEFSKNYFFYHKKQCGTTENRYQCPYCPLSFSHPSHKLCHIQQQHSKNPQRFTCPECNQVFTNKKRMKTHLETVCSEVKSCYKCFFCNASYTRQDSRQRHMRKVHGCVCREQEVNLFLPLQHLSEEPDCKDEWMIVESRPIEENEHKICPCGQTHIKSYFFLENKINGNRTFVGSTCIKNIDPRVGNVIAYFSYILIYPIQGTYQGKNDEGLQGFTVMPNTFLVRGSEVVEHLNPQVTKNLKNEHEVLVKHSRPETLIQGQTYDLRLKAKYVRGQLTFTAL